MKLELNLQYFGGRGASAASSGKNIITFKPKQKQGSSNNSNTKKWDYPGEKERVDRLIENAKNAKTINQINRAAMALKRQDEHITTLLSTVSQDDGDERVLMSLRRKIRQQRMVTKL